MINVSNDMYKKSSLIQMNIARDFYLMHPGDRVPTILEYTEKFSVSRGIVQNAIRQLEEDGCIEIEKRGVKGTFLRQIDSKKLCTHTGWGSLIGTMPLPLSIDLTSLATALGEQLENAAFPFSFAYITGSERRMRALEQMMYDFIVVTRSTALKYLENFDFVRECITLYHCSYASDFVVYFVDPSKHEIENGMRVAVDRTCRDQWELTQRLCSGKQVEYISFPYISFEDLVRKKVADCVIYRFLDNTERKDSDLWKMGLHAEPIQGIEPFYNEDAKIPVVLVHKENYNIDRLLQKYIDPVQSGSIQQAVCSGEKAYKLY
ncbi:MAG: GntR family transcriptional regulator [Lachnospiraceae bacterium]|jgi:hypothetical protein|nr:GntR family transcriptional regulator [Lachnospiraceae bacterium]